MAAVPSLAVPPTKVSNYQQFTLLGQFPFQTARRFLLVLKWKTLLLGEARRRLCRRVGDRY